MKSKFILCLSLILGGGVAGCTSVRPLSPEVVSYSQPSAENLQNIKVTRVCLTSEKVTQLASLPKDETEFGSQWLVEEKPDTARSSPWNTELYILNSAETNRCVRIDLLDHADYEIRHSWLNEKMLFVRVPCGRIAWTDFILNTETMRFSYIEDGMYIETIEKQEAAESQEK